MKFDYAIGNPPYHYETGKRKIPLYNKFIMGLTNDNSFANKVCLITPDGFIKGGQQLEALRKFLIEKKHLYSIEFHQDNVFSDVTVNAAITFFDNEHTWENIEKTIIHKNGSIEKSYLDWEYRDVIIDETKYKILNLFENKVACDNNMSTVIPGRTVFASAFNSKCFNSNKDKFKTEKDENHPIKVLVWGDQDFYFINPLDNFGYSDSGEDNTDMYLNISNNQYKVAFPKAGNVKKAPLKTTILNPNDIFIDKFLCIFTNTYEEAINAEKYFNSKFYRAGLDSKMTSWNMYRNWHSNIPIQDFTNNSDIDWSKSSHEIDIQLYEKYNFTEDEIKMVEKYIK